MSEQPIPFPSDDMPSDWTVSPLTQCCVSIVDGDWIETKDQGGQDFRLLQVSNVGVGEFVETGAFRYITRETFDRLRCSEVKPGHILVSRMPDPVGRALYVQRLPWRAVTAVDVAIIEVDTSVLDARFCTYYLNSPYNLAHAQARATGTTRPRITRRDLAQFPVPLPPLPTQRKVAAILSAYDDLIENNTRRIAILEEMAQMLYREWFVHFRFPGHEDVEMVDSELGAIPYGWELRLLGDVGHIVLGKTPSKKVPEYYGDDMPFIKIPDMYAGIFCIQAGDSLSRAGIESQRNKTVPEDSICVSCIGTIGLVSITSVPSQTNQQINTLVPDGPTQREFLYFALSDLKTTMENRGAGATMTYLSKTEFSKLRIVFPADDVLVRFRYLARPIFAQIKNLQLKNMTLRQARDLLLPRLVSGELDVADLPIEGGALAA